MDIWLLALITGTVIPGIVAFIVQHYMKKFVDSEAERKKKEEDFTLIVIESLKALTVSNKALFEAFKTGRTNGNLDKAMLNADRVERKLEEFLINQASKK